MSNGQPYGNKEERELAAEMRSTSPVPTGQPGPTSVTGHGLWYITRDTLTAVRLDFDMVTGFGVPGTGIQDVSVYGAERAVMRALLMHAVEMLDRADADRTISPLVQLAYPSKKDAR